ncbi:hypothetical protein [Streptosporangium sp. KLBMP 9127]|nr:hypothetical protein [Streptosporangium sp. KLBMP 9127]
MTSPPGGGSRKKRPVLVPVVAVLLATGMGATAVLGGLDQVPDPPPKQLGAGQFLDQGLYRTQFVGAKSYVTPSDSEYVDDKRFLDLEFKVINLGQDTDVVGGPSDPARPSVWSAFANSVLRTTPPVKGKYGADTFVFDRGVRSKQLHPGITSTVVVRYQLELNAEVPEKLTLDVGGHEYVAGFNDPSSKWQLLSKEVNDKYIPVTVAKVTLPVRKEGA